MTGLFWSWRAGIEVLVEYLFVGFHFKIRIVLGHVPRLSVVSCYLLPSLVCERHIEGIIIWYYWLRRALKS